MDWAAVETVRSAARDWSRRRAEARLWREVPDVAHLRELMARFVEGELASWPYHRGPREPETVEIAPSLAAANRRGFITTGSQPGYRDDEGRGWDQRAAVDGHAAPHVVAQLRGLIAGTRLLMLVHEQPAPRRIDYDTAVCVTRRGGQDYTVFGAHLTAAEIVNEFDGVPARVVDELIAMPQVTIIDPVWGPHELLWERLGEPDWDNPSPPPTIEETAAVATKKTDEQIVREEYERLARAIAEDEIRRGAPQFAGSAPAVPLAELRRALITRRNPGQTTWSRERQDAALDRLGLADGVHVREQANRQLLTDADRAAAIRLGGEDRHMLMIEPSEWSAPPPAAPPVSGASSGPVPAPAAAGQVRTFADLLTVDIDPFGYPEQLPEHLGQVHQLLVARAAELDQEARRLEQEADALHVYADYMDGAEVVGELVETLQDAADTFSGQSAARRAVAEQVAEAAEQVAEAQRVAEARYGDNQVPRFDRAG